MEKYNHIKELRFWSPERVMTMCIKHCWYTRGNNADYSDMLDVVRATANPRTKDILEIADDIYIHSDRMSCASIVEVATAIVNEAVMTYFEEVKT